MPKTKRPFVIGELNNMKEQREFKIGEVVIYANTKREIKFVSQKEIGFEGGLKCERNSDHLFKCNQPAPQEKKRKSRILLDRQPVKS